MYKPWRVIPLNTTCTSEGLSVAANITEATSGLFNCSPEIKWAINTKDVETFVGGHFHQSNTRHELLAPLNFYIEVELHSNEACEVVRLESDKNEALLVQCGVYHLARIQPGGILLCIQSVADIPGDRNEFIKCKCKQEG